MEKRAYEDSKSEFEKSNLPISDQKTLNKGEYNSLQTEADDKHGKTILMHIGSALVTNVLERFMGLIWELL